MSWPATSRRTHREEFVANELLAVVFGSDKRRNQVVAGFAAAQFDQCIGPCNERVGCGPGRGECVEIDRQFVERGEGNGPVVEVVTVALGHVGEFGDRHDRKRSGDLVDHVERRRLRELVEHPIDHVGEPGSDGFHSPGREGLSDQRSDPRVLLRRIGEQQHVLGDHLHRRFRHRRESLTPRTRGCDAESVVAQQLVDVGVS